LARFHLSFENLKGLTMALGDERSLGDLQEQAERSRAELTETADQLRAKVSDTVTDYRKRLSPEALKAEAQNYVRTRADALFDKARDNPLQAAAIGLGVAYPLLGIIRAIPAPIMMVGAGLFLLGSSSGQKAASDASKKLGEVADSVSDSLGASAELLNRKAHDVQDVASAGLASARDTVASGLDGAAQQVSAAAAKIGDLKSGAAALVASASEGVTGLTQQAADAVGSTSDTLRGSAARTGSMVRDAAASAADYGTDTARRLRDRAAETSRSASSAVGETIQQHPLLVGGLGLAIGMLIASALPRSDVEKSIMGNVSGDVQKRANEFASRGFDAAKGIASGAIADLADRAGQENLTPTDIGAAAEDLGRRVRKVAESATEAAFGAKNQEPATSGEFSQLGSRRAP
jgi:ElaB/YqjD/DUF883 family membrane-anchored ribosome-binding protein